MQPRPCLCAEPGSKHDAEQILLILDGLGVPAVTREPGGAVQGANRAAIERGAMDGGCPGIAAVEARVQSNGARIFAPRAARVEAGPGGCSFAADTGAFTDLARREAGFRQAFAAAPVAMGLLDEVLRFTLVNDALAELLGRPCLDIVGRRYAELVEGGSAGARILELMPGAEHVTRTVERRFARPDGSLRTARVSVTPTAGADPGFLVVLQDVTVLRSAERALRDSEERYRLMTESSPSVSWISDISGWVEFISERWTRLTGQPTPAARGRGWLSHVHPDDAVRFEEAFTRCLREGAETHVEFRVRHRDGTWRWMLSRTVPQRSADGRPIRYFGTIVDIDEVKFAEEALRSAQHLQAVGQLAGGVAHEVNNMMAVVMGFASLILPTMDPGDRRHGWLREILTASNRTAHITRQLLAFGRRQVLQAEVVDLDVVVRDLGELVHRLITKDVDLRVDVPRAAQWVRVDRAQIEQVVINLALNARDAMPAGGRLSLRVRPHEQRTRRALGHPRDVVEPGAYVVLEVRDTGAGMDPPTLQRSLEPFFTTKPQGAGTGLGLSMVYGIVRQSGGYLSLHSEPGKGTRVDILLPREAAPAARREERAPEEPSIAGSETVLVVDDEEAVRTMIAAGLRDAGYRVIEAGGGSEALEHLQAGGGAVDVMVTDLVMPGMGGQELGRRVREGWPDIGVLYVSGHPGEEVAQRGLLAEGGPLLEKPFAIQTLGLAVRALLDA